MALSGFSGQLPEAGDAIVIGQGVLKGRNPSGSLHIGNAGNHQTDAAAGQLFHHLDLFRGDLPVSSARPS